ncbi:MAG: alkaline phosphatase family protein [Clostridia bacterium]|nr:alkaline phosphatase family protein [Clostridia bacterium]
MKNFIMPDWTNSNLNISATIAEFLGAPNKNATLPSLKSELAKGYKNVVFICFDGLGIYPIKQNLPEDDFLRKSIKRTLVSTFPSTTTNATTSLTRNKLPLEHGWFGWSLYFKNIGRNINIFLNTDSWTNEKVEITDSPLEEPDYYFDHAQSEYQINTIFPAYSKVAYPQRNHVFGGEQEFFGTIKDICNRQGKQFIYAYYNEPDSTMHRCGVTSRETKSVITSISENMKELAAATRDTLFIVTADHGQIDVEGYVELYKDKTLYDMLETYPYLEPRAISFKVKKGKEEEFEKYFTENYSEDFRLFKTAELLKENYFGSFGDKAGLLGDFIAVGTYTHKVALLTPDAPRFKGHHTGLTEEMEVPLILINN